MRPKIKAYGRVTPPRNPPPAEKPPEPQVLVPAPPPFEINVKEDLKESGPVYLFTDPENLQK